MSIFNYKAKNKNNENQEGMIEAFSENEAVDLLMERGLFVLELKEKKLWSLNLGRSLFQRVPEKDLVVFSRQLSVMISASVPLVQALRILVDQTANTHLKLVISEIADEIEGGARLSEAFNKYPHIFNDFTVNIIKSGETSGKLDIVLDYLADTKERDYDLIHRIRGALIYPLLVLLSIMGVAVFVIVSVIPKILELVGQAGAGRELPLATRVLMELSNFFIFYGWILLLGLIVLVVTGKIYLKTPTGKLRGDSLKLKLPLFGKLFQKIYIVRFSRSLATLMSGGVPVTLALRVVGDVIGNYYYRELISKTIREVDDGNSLATVFIESKLVPMMVSQMIITGEETGKLDKILGKLTDFYEREINNTVNNLVSLIEPVIILLMGVAVGGLMAAIILPMYNLAYSF